MTEPSAGSTGFDPRFDPAFQPGYDPQLHGAATRDSSGDEPVTGAGTDDPAADAQLNLNAPPAAESNPLRAPLSVPSRPDDEPAPVPIRIREPYLVALWAVSAVFIVAGVSLLRYMTDRLNALTTSGGGNASDYSLLRAFEIGAPLLIVLGLATATGTLFLLAARRRHAA